MTQGQLRTRLPILAALVVLLIASFGTSVEAHPGHGAHPNRLPTHASETMKAFARDQNVAQASSGALSNVQCVGGKAGPYPCNNVNLLSYLPLADIGATGSSSKANDIWGWTDPTNAREYAIIGHVFGTSFVDITSPTAPVYLGQLPTHGNFGSSWRDIKVYADHAFIVSEASRHGMQVFDLTQLRGRTGPPITFSETAHYSGISTAHNIAINEATGYAYIVGAAGKNSCEGGLHMVNIGSPASPSFAGCYSADGYTHDTQCVVYDGPDAAHQTKEICFNSNEDTLTIVDVSDKSNPVLLSRTSYTGSAYTHQGWLTEDQRYFLIDDELDEQNFGHRTRTRVFDIADLTAPSVTRVFDSSAGAIDHNQYVKGTRVYQANYTAGLRLLDFTDLATSNLTEFGYFDVYPDGDAPTFNGAWSTYPYYPSGNVVISGIEQGLFVVRATDATTPPPPDSDPDPDAPMHLGELTGSPMATRGGKWDASVTIPVHDDTEQHGPVVGATVSGTWSDGATGSDSCITNTTGACTVTKTNISRHSASATFTVTDVSLSGFIYTPASNDVSDSITLHNPN